MSDFDDFDLDAAEAVAELYGDLVTWLPMRSKGVARERTNKSLERDPTRPIRQMTAILSWKPNVIDPAGATDPQAGVNRGAVMSFDCLVDFTSVDFVTPDGNLVPPKKGDILRFDHEVIQGNRYMQVARPGDDGSQRFMFYCSTPSQIITDEDFTALSDADYHA